MRKLHTITKQYLEQNLKRGTLAIGISTTHLNPNPRLKKYYFWIYHYNMPYSSAEEVFWKDEHKLSLKEASNLMSDLKKKGIPYAYVNLGIKRLRNSVFDYETIIKEDSTIKFAVSYDEDTDTICAEYNNHR